MKKLYTTLTMVALALAASAAGQDVMLYGQLYTGQSDYGIYRFSSGQDAAIEKVADIAAVPNCGSVSAGNRFYTFSAEAGDYGTEYAAYVYDSSDDFLLVTRIGSAYSIAKEAQVLAYDASENKIYSVFQESGYYGGTESYLGLLNISNRTITKIGSSLYFGYGNTAIVAMAFSPEGELYAIASNSYLYKIDKTNGNLTSIGSTGIYPQYEQSMTFSPDGNTIYWAACNDDINALYSVDPASGKAEKIKDFANAAEFVSLWVGDAISADGAPAAAQDLKVEFEGASLTGTFSFTAPGLTHAGDELTGELDYEIKANGVAVATGKTTPGAPTSCEITLPQGGLTDFSVVLSNEAGKGDEATLNRVFAGQDTPQYVENLQLVRGESDNEFVVSWDFPAVGVHGGYIDPESVKFRVRRLPEFEVISEDAKSPFTDTFVSDIPVKCSYEVMPYIDENISGLPMTTNSIMTGAPFQLPYSENFDNLDHEKSWTIVDANDDGHSWEYQWDMGYYRIYDNERAKDDWMMSPYFLFEEGHDYRVSFDIRTIASEELEIFIGEGLEPADMQTVIFEKELIPDTNFKWVSRNATFSIAKTARMHIGFHAATSSPSDALALYLDNVKVEHLGMTSAQAPASGASLFHIEGRSVVADSDADLTICLPDGRVAASGSYVSGQSISLAPGLYIIGNGTAASKIMIR